MDQRRYYGNESLSRAASIGICPAPDVYKTWDFEALESDEASGVSESEKRQKESGRSLAQKALIPTMGIKCSLLLLFNP